MREQRLKYAKFWLKRLKYRGVVVMKIQQEFDVSRMTAYRDIKKCNIFERNSDNQL